MNNNDAGAGSLRDAIDQMNTAGVGPHNITFNAAVTTITLASSLPPLTNNATIVIDGSGGTGTTVDGAGVAQAFFVQTGTVTISNMAITNATATGGAGGAGAGGGGGGLGAGGAVFVNAGATVTLDTVSFSNSQATGGTGGDGSGTAADGGGGGGGISGGSTIGDGGDGSLTGGGGGGGGLGAAGSNGSGGTGGAGGGTGGAGGNSGANGNAGSNAFGAGGGGGAGNGNGGAGQFGAGGGGGGGAAGLGGAASFGGGDGGDSEDGGDGGDGLGGAVFVRQGGTLTVIDSDISGGGAAGGAGGTGSDENGTAGTGAGASMYVHTGVNAELQVMGANTNTIDDSISGPGGITKTGTGTMVLSGINDYTGGTTVEDGTLQSGGAGALPDNTAYTVNGGILDLNGNDLTMSSLQGTGGEIQLNSGAELTVTNTNVNTEYAGDISGTGKFILTGNNFLTLSGTNTYTGDTEVQGGLLSGTTDSLQGTIINDSELEFNQDFDGTFSGNISGTGNVTKSGPGEVTFDGNNTFIGELTVTAGKLIAGSATAFPDVVFRINGGTLDLNSFDATTSGLIGNAAGTIELGTAMLTADQTTTTTFAGVINGDGSLVKNGTGTLTLSGVNTFTGGVTVEDGILASGAVGAFPDDIPYIVNGGTLDLNNRNLTMSSLNGTGGTVDLGSADLIVDTTTSDTYDGDIVGTGSLTKDGTGDLTLNGANTYSGGTTVEEGMLIQGADGALPGDTDYTVNGGTLDLGGFPLTMSSLQGTGGTVDLGAALLTVNQSTDTTYEGVITGTGGLTKQGAGALTLEGTNTYTGATTIETGSLVVNGSIDSNVTVQMDGTLAGSGMVNGDVDNAGTVIPGPAGTDTIGTLNVDGNYTHQSDANLEIGLNTNVDVLAVTGTADLQGGTVTVTPTASNFNIGLKYTFLTAGTVTGTFDMFEADFGNLEAVPEYESDQVSFTLLVNGMTFEQQGRTRNERAVGRYLDEIAPTATGDLQDVFTALSNLNPFEVSQAEDELGGAVHGTLAQIGVQNTTLVIAQISQRLRSAAFSAGGMQGGSGEMPMYSHSRPDRKRDDLPIVLVSAGPDGGPLFDFDGGGGSGTNWTPWAQGFGMGGKAASDGNADEVKYNMGGVVAGLERWLDHCWLLGYYGGYVGTQVATEDPRQNINGGQIGAYLYSDDGCNYTTLLGGFEFDGYKTHRHIQFDTIDRVASADASGWQGFGYAERGYAFRGCNNVVQPFIALQYIHLQRNDFTETGADSIDLAVDRMTTDSLRVMPGARLQYSFCTRNGLRFLPELHGAWVHEFLDTSTALNARFGPVGGAGFTVEGLDMGQNWALLGVNATWELHDGWSMFVNYDAMFNKPQELHLGSAGFGHVW